MQTEEIIKERIKFYEKQQKETDDIDYKIMCGMIIGNLKWVLLEGSKNQNGGK